jgi:peptidoglycan/LPS O-acetylase OafA/YrhL
VSGPPNGRVAALDGLRAVSIALVLIGHLGGTRHFLSMSSLAACGDVGNLGVSVFFVISGFLITTLLLKEAARDRRIDLRAFYVRRAFRILPAAGVHLIVLATLATTTAAIAISPSDWRHALTFTMNYQPDRSWYVGHLWSLSVEEQFYVLWPAAMLLLGPRRSIWLAAAAIAAAPLWRTLVWVCWPAARAGIGETFPTVMDAIAAGCVLAGLADRLARQACYRRFLASPAFAAVPAIVLLCTVFDRFPSFYLPIGMTARNVGIAALVHWAMLRSNRFATRLLESAPLGLAGRISYSLYLWQQLFLNHHRDGLLTMFPVNVACAVACAVLSFFLVETPMLRLRERLSGFRRADALPGARGMVQSPAATA